MARFSLIKKKSDGGKNSDKYRGGKQLSSL